MKSSPSSVAGFTLLELLVVIAVVGILATLTLPSFTSLIQSQRVKNAGFELYAGLSLARSEAIKRNGDVTITPRYCQVTSPGPAHNEVGWVIGTTTTTIRDQSQLKGITITVTPANTPANTLCTTTANTPWLTYQRTGRTTATVAPTFLIDAYGVTSQTQFAKCIKIELSGMPRIYKPVNGACA